MWTIQTLLVYVEAKEQSASDLQLPILHKGWTCGLRVYTYGWGEAGQLLFTLALGFSSGFIPLL